ncbi:MAG: hypothetical protein NC453_28205 [Muribaculum sp.]|nr:hypothetical protein [Muribaculum sp.]
MKKVYNFLALMLCCAIAFMATSCGDDNDEPDAAVTETSLIGKWLPVTSGENYDFDYVEFLSNHTGAFYFIGDEPHDFKWSLKSNTLTIDFIYGDKVYERFVGTVVINGDRATVDGTSTSFEMEGESWDFSLELKRVK